MFDCNQILEVLATSFFETLSPTRCIICDVPGDILCPSCASLLPFIDFSTACPRCGAPYGGMLCTECPMPRSELDVAHPENRFPFIAARAALSYEGASKRIVRGYKDENELRLDTTMASLICRAMRGRLPPGIAMCPSDGPMLYSETLQGDWTRWANAIVPIPATPDAIRRRGFDHMLRIGHLCSAWTGLPLSCALTPRTRVADQRKLGREERRENLEGSFVADFAPSETPRHIIVIDDVFTTGATSAAAANALLDAGAEQVAIVALARVW